MESQEVKAGPMSTLLHHFSDHIVTLSPRMSFCSHSLLLSPLLSLTCTLTLRGKHLLTFRFTKRMYS